VIQRARDAGDRVASAILERAATELAAAAEAVATRLGLRDQACHVVLAGGVFKVVPWLAGELRRRLAAMAPRSQVGVLECEPAVGAVSLAIEEARGRLTLPHYGEWPVHARIADHE
jgi:N-acetylglucosamine kinase-like BadF-type ATPase